MNTLVDFLCPDDRRENDVALEIAEVLCAKYGHEHWTHFLRLLSHNLHPNVRSKLLEVHYIDDFNDLMDLKTYLYETLGYEWNTVQVRLPKAIPEPVLLVVITYGDRFEIIQLKVTTIINTIEVVISKKSNIFKYLACWLRKDR